MLYQKLIAFVVDPSGSENDDPFVYQITSSTNKVTITLNAFMFHPLCMKDTIVSRSRSVAAEQLMPSG